jgi:hypothetical protein
LKRALKWLICRWNRITLAWWTSEAHGGWLEKRIIRRRLLRELRHRNYWLARGPRPKKPLSPIETQSIWDSVPPLKRPPIVMPDGRVYVDKA